MAMPQGSPSTARQEHPRHPTQHASDPELWGRAPGSTASSLPGLMLCTPAPTVQSPKDHSHTGARRCTEANTARVPLLRLGSGLALVAVLESRTGGSWGTPDSGKASAGLQGRGDALPHTGEGGCFAGPELGATWSSRLAGRSGKLFPPESRGPIPTPCLVLSTGDPSESHG